jgi:hypothetical protein
MPGGSRSLPDQPNLRYLRLEAKRRLAAGEFPTLHDAQAGIAREHGEPSWAALKQLVCDPANQESHALDQLRWVISRFSGGYQAGLGWLLSPRGDTAMHSGGGYDATAYLTVRVRDNRTLAVLTSRMIPVNTVADRLLRSWT